VAYNHRTSYTCAELSFSDIAEGALPTTSIDISTGLIQELTSPDDVEQTDRHHIIEMVICSFALHLLEDTSGLFSLLWELSSKARWLVVLAPHKKPEV
jgi:cell division inhibitor SulA